MLTETSVNIHIILRPSLLVQLFEPIPFLLACFRLASFSHYFCSVFDEPFVFLTCPLQQLTESSIHVVRRRTKHTHEEKSSKWESRRSRRAGNVSLSFLRPSPWNFLETFRFLKFVIRACACSTSGPVSSWFSFFFLVHIHDEPWDTDTETDWNLKPPCYIGSYFLPPASLQIAIIGIKFTWSNERIRENEVRKKNILIFVFRQTVYPLWTCYVFNMFSENVRSWSLYIHTAKGPGSDEPNCKNITQLCRTSHLILMFFRLFFLYLTRKSSIHLYVLEGN